MTTHEHIKNDLKESMRAKDSVRTTTLRSILSACTSELITQGKKPDAEVDDETVLTVIKRSVKQHKDSIAQYENAGRTELADAEKEELAILEQYLPEQMSKDDIQKVAEAKKEELGISDKSQMGQLMGAVMQEVKGKADGSDVKDVIEGLLE